MLDPRARELASGANFAVLTTLLADGTPQSHVMWVDTDGDHLLINTEVHRSKFRNLWRDGRATVTLIDRDDPYSYVEVRGEVSEVVRGPEARDHIDRLSRKYFGRDYDNPIKSERVIVKIRPLRQIVH
jgi:PPOX class probable F420-dependent enzyme